MSLKGNELQDEYEKQVSLVSDLDSARTALAHDSSSVDPSKMMDIQAKYKKAVDDLNKLNSELLKVQQETENSIKNTSSSIDEYRKTLHNNQKLFKKYNEDIQKKTHVVATRDRMLQLSQERNIYKKKIIYVLFSIIIALFVGVLVSYSFYRKMSK